MTARRWLWALVLVAASACTDLRDRGDTLYKQRKFDEAASAYDQYLVAHPSDKTALEGRRRAREEQLRAQVRKIQRERVANRGRDAANELASLLSRRDTWHERLDRDLVAAIEFELADAGARIGSEVAAQITSSGPLAGEAAANVYQALLDQHDLATTRGAIHTQLREAGRARCAQLAPDDGPYAQWIAAAYCAHWGTPRVVPPLPEQRASLAVDGTIAGETAREVDALHAALATAFQRTAWFARSTNRPPNPVTTTTSRSRPPASHPRGPTSRPSRTSPQLKRPSWSNRWPLSSMLTTGSSSARPPRSRSTKPHVVHMPTQRMYLTLLGLRCDPCSAQKRTT